MFALNEFYLNSNSQDHSVSCSEIIRTPDLSGAGKVWTSNLKAQGGRALTDWSQPAGSHFVSRLLWKPQEARTFGKGSPRPFLEQGTSRLRLLPRFLHPGRPARSSPPPGARGLTWRGVSASHPRPGTCERRTNSNLPRLTHPRLGAGGGSGVSGDSHKVSPPGTRRRRPGRARCAGPGPGLSQVLPATHLGKEAVHCSGARTFPAPLQLRKSEQRQIPGIHACHGAPRGDSSPRSRRAAIPRSLLLLRTFCPRLGPPPSQLQPLSLLPPSSSLLGEVLPGGEQLVAHSSPAGGGRQGAGDAPSSL